MTSSSVDSERSPQSSLFYIKIQSLLSHQSPILSAAHGLIIFVHAYKHHKDWKRFLVKRIMAIEEQRHDEVMKMLQGLQF